MDFTTSSLGIAALAIFVVAYVLVMLEDRLHLRKSIPVMIAAGVIWSLVAIAYGPAGRQAATAAFGDNLLKFGELLLFLLAAVTYVNTMEERQVFDAMRAWLVGRRVTLRALFWITGIIAFFLSSVLDNLTTALVVSAVAIAIGGTNTRFVAVSCISTVVAANAGGAFSPFGDITTLMVWQAGILPFFTFFKLFVPALLNWLVPAVFMSFAIDRVLPAAETRAVRLRPGAMVVVAMFAATIVLTVALHNFLHLPPVLGMMTGLGALNLYSAWMTRSSGRTAEAEILAGFKPTADPADTFDILGVLRRIEWDTFMFFYGVIMCVGGIGALGYLAVMSRAMFEGIGPTSSNVLIGVLSAIVDNIPLMFAVISMRPEMSDTQWLLVTLTTGVGGSLLSIGSAAGVALMGQARGIYTFTSHLKWTWAIALGYAASIGAHLLINGR